MVRALFWFGFGVVAFIANFYAEGAWRFLTGVLLIFGAWVESFQKYYSKEEPIIKTEP